MLRPAYPIETERLLLRPYGDGDVDAVLAYHSREDVARYLYWEPRRRDEVREVVQRKASRTAIAGEGDSLELAVVPRGATEPIGEVMLVWQSRRHRQGEVGYVFHPDHTGRGYATEATAAMLRLGFEELGLHRIYGRLDARNTPSARLLERLGMRREAHLVENEWVKGMWTDEVIYAMLDREWQARSPH